MYPGITRAGVLMFVLLCALAVVFMLDAKLSHVVRHQEFSLIGMDITETQHATFESFGADCVA